jgi:hypothetical protein
MKTASNNVLRNEANEFADSGETAIIENVAVALPPAVIHCRDAADESTLKDTFDLSKIAGEVKVVHGLDGVTKAAMLLASAKGTRIVTTGMPLDIAASIGEVTVIKTWAARTTAEGNKYPARSEVPVVISVRKVLDKEAYARLKESEDFKLAFGAGQPEDSPF